MINNDPKLKLLDIFNIEEIRRIYMGKELLITHIDTNWIGYISTLKDFYYTKILVKEIIVSNYDIGMVYFRMHDGYEWVFLETFFDFNFPIQEKIIL